MIMVDSIKIPDRFVAVCKDWHGGQGDLLYAVASTGNLTRGCVRPQNEDGEWASDEEWYYSLWYDLSVCVSRALSACFKSWEDSDDLAILTEFEYWIDNKVLPSLVASYGLD